MSLWVSDGIARAVPFPTYRFQSAKPPTRVEISPGMTGGIGKHNRFVANLDILRPEFPINGSTEETYP
jgi:hypothetical protein